MNSPEFKSFFLNVQENINAIWSGIHHDGWIFVKTLLNLPYIALWIIEIWLIIMLDDSQAASFSIYIEIFSDVFIYFLLFIPVLFDRIIPCNVTHGNEMVSPFHLVLIKLQKWVVNLWKLHASILKLSIYAQVLNRIGACIRHLCC